MPATTSNGGKFINHLLQRTSFTQSYYALRHGQSLANVDKIIQYSNDPKFIEYKLLNPSIEAIGKIKKVIDILELSLRIQVYQIKLI